MEYFAWIYAVSLFFALLVSLKFGRRFGRQKPDEESDSASAGKKIVEGAFLGFFSLLIALTFSGAVSRFDHRRKLIVNESNDIGTAYLRIDLLSASSQPQMRELFRMYLDSRLTAYQKMPDIEAADRELARSAGLQAQIWQNAVSATKAPDSHPDAGKLLLPAINAMIDITNSRAWAARMHPPMVVYGLLFVVAIISAFIAGYSLSPAKSSVRLYMLAFALLSSISIYIILEIEYPRMGFIDIEKYDRALIELRESMK